jgi:hypothetical protein
MQSPRIEERSERAPRARRRRALALCALTLLLAVGGFVAAQFPNGERAEAANCDVVARCAASVPKPRTASPATALIRERLAAQSALHGRIAKPPTTAKSPRQTETPRHTKTARRTKPAPARAPSTCAEVVAGIAWPHGWRVQCAGPRAGVLGTTEPSGVTTVFVRAGESMSWLRTVALHEAGHAWDFSHLDAARIAQWCTARGCDPARFFAGGASSAGWSEPGGAEDWASAWDACHGGEYARSYLGLPVPTAAQCDLQNALVGYHGV